MSRRRRTKSSRTRPAPACFQKLLLPDERPGEMRGQVEDDGQVDDAHHRILSRTGAARRMPRPTARMSRAGTRQCPQDPAEVLLPDDLGGEPRGHGRRRHEVADRRRWPRGRRP